MIVVTLLWSTAGVVTRSLEGARSFEVTFWRSFFNALALVLALAAMRRPAGLLSALRQGGWVLWGSGVCWAVMFTNFMVALTLTTVANVLVTMALAPVFTALLAGWVLRVPLPRRTWCATAVAGTGIVWIYGAGIAAADVRQVLGTAVALGVPVAAAINWTLLQCRRPRGALSTPALQNGPACPPDSAALRNDMLPAVLIGALLSAAVSLPWALPFSASRHDLVLLGLLGVGQLAIPCLLAVAAARALNAPEVALLTLLEVIFGIAWAWLCSGETPSVSMLGGGALVLAALAANEVGALRRRSPGGHAGESIRSSRRVQPASDRSR
jgi:drug/metabolite transporter (DMT)-like permease